MVKSLQQCFDSQGCLIILCVLQLYCHPLLRRRKRLLNTSTWTPAALLRSWTSVYHLHRTPKPTATRWTLHWPSSPPLVLHLLRWLWDPLPFPGCSVHGSACCRSPQRLMDSSCGPVKIPSLLRLLICEGDVIRGRSLICDIIQSDWLVHYGMIMWLGVLLWVQCHIIMPQSHLIYRHNLPTNRPLLLKFTHLRSDTSSLPPRYQSVFKTLSKRELSLHWVYIENEAPFRTFCSLTWNI